MGANTSSNAGSPSRLEQRCRTLSPSSSTAFNDFERNAGGRISSTSTRSSSVVASSSSKFRRFIPFTPKLMAVGQRFGLVSTKRAKKFISSSSSAAVGSSSSISGSKRQRSRNRDHCRIFRELILNWQLRDLHCLVVEFEASLALRELTSRADFARPLAPNVRDDLHRLYQNGIASDLTLSYEGVEFPVHKSFLIKRCSFFRRLFRQFPPSRRRIVVNFNEYKTRLNLEAFVLLLEYLYTGEICTDSRQSFAASAFDLLLKFRDEIETVRRLEDDLMSMYKNPDANDADAVLIFSNSNRVSAELSETLLENSQNLSTEQQRYADIKNLCS